MRNVLAELGAIVNRRNHLNAPAGRTRSPFGPPRSSAMTRFMRRAIVAYDRTAPRRGLRHRVRRRNDRGCERHDARHDPQRGRPEISANGARRCCCDRPWAPLVRRRAAGGGPKRLIVTRRILAIASDPSHRNALFWNPTGAHSKRPSPRWVARRPPCDDWRDRGVRSFSAAYDAFHLTQAAERTFRADDRCFRKYAELDAGQSARPPWT